MKKSRFFWVPPCIVVEKYILLSFSALNLPCSCTQQDSECSRPSNCRDWKTWLGQTQAVYGKTWMQKWMVSAGHPKDTRK